jgi:hypothetical protein
MSSFPNFSNVNQYIVDETTTRKDNPSYLSSLNAWIRVASGVGDGLIVTSNPDYALLAAAGDDEKPSPPSIYGNSKLAGTIGKTWAGKAVTMSEGQGYRPIPTISSIEVDEGAGNLSRKASFSITAYTLEQMEEVVKYFLEPGFTIFLEWGWNQPDAFIDWHSTLDANTVAQYQSFKKTNDKRTKTSGLYDNYLGYITAGGVSISEDKWQIEVKCTGFTELPAYLITTDTGEENAKEADNVEDFRGYEIDSVKDIGIQRFMRMFNDLPSTRKVASIRNLIGKTNNRNYRNATAPSFIRGVDFINFDEDATSKLNDLTNGGWFSRATKDLGGESITFPKGTELVKEDNKYVSFGFLMSLINEGISVNSYQIGDREVNITIDTSATYISAFKNMYSTDASRLFIPNQNTPNVSAKKIMANSLKTELSNTNKTSIANLNNPIDNRVSDDSITIQFPASSKLNKIAVPGFKDAVKKDEFKWGYLNDLYVNFNYAKSILDTPNFAVKDALYQILNGMSSAVNGLWNFQIIEDAETIDKKDTTILRVVDLNFVSDTDIDKVTWVLDLIGANSVFQDASFKMDLGGAKMGQVIGKRLQTTTNSELSAIPENLFAVDSAGNNLNDKVLTKINKKKVDPPKKAEGGKSSDEDKQEAALKLFLEKLHLVPNIKITNSTDGYNGLLTAAGVKGAAYLAAYHDKSLFNALNTDAKNSDKSVSPLLPINFGFTIHGISGIKRGDKFKVTGIPAKYSKGFFQVLSVKHIVDGMQWKTEIEGGYRQ